VISCCGGVFLRAFNPPAIFVLGLAGAAHAEGVCDAIDVVEPGSDQSDLENSAIIEADCAQSCVIRRATLRGIFGQFHDVVEHDAVLIRDRRVFVVLFQRLDHFLVERDATQKLCVRFYSIMATVGYRNHGGDHFVLIACERQIGREQNAVSAEGVKESIGKQCV
jgi:hypothetical protein